MADVFIRNLHKAYPSALEAALKKAKEMGYPFTNIHVYDREPSGWLEYALLCYSALPADPADPGKPTYTLVMLQRRAGERFEFHS